MQGVVKAAVAALGVSLVSVGAACAGALVPDSPSGEAPPATVSPSELPAGQGRAEVVAACVACHPATIFTAKHLSADKWAEVVDQMISKGAKVGDADYDTIVGYLAHSFGPVPAPKG